MSHADDDLLYSRGGAGFDQGIENSDQGFATFKGKSFLADVSGVEKPFEGLGCDNLF